jgi:hypothetical protein
VFLDTIEKTASQPSFPDGFEGFISDSFELAFQLPLYASDLDLSTWDTPVAPDEGPPGQYQIPMKTASRYRQNALGKSKPSLAIAYHLTICASREFQNFQLS